jgi:hypothetical protein
LKYFEPVQLPLVLRPTGNYPERKPRLTDSESADTLFYKQAFSIACYGLLPDTTDYYGIIWLAPADLNYPVITTYNKKGEIIDESGIQIGYCGSDCGYDCSETITIGQSLDIFSIDSIRVTDCDAQGHLIDSTLRRYVIYKTGQITKKGKIELAEEVREDLK